MILATVSPKIQKVSKKGILAPNDLFFLFLRPQKKGGGSSYPGFVQKNQKP